MTRDVIVVEEDTKVEKLLETLLEQRISCVPVLNKKKKLVGIVTKTDIIGHLMDFDIDLTLQINLKDILHKSAEHGDSEISSVTDMDVKNIMTKNPITVKEDTPVESLATTMIENNIHRLIVTKGKDIAGIVSTIDILYHVAGIRKTKRKKSG